MTPPTAPGLQRQLELYMAGMMQQQPSLPLAFDALEAQARSVLRPEAFDYVAGGAGAEDTMRANRTAFQRWQIVPRMLCDVSQRDLRATLFGQTLPAPVLLAPVGVLGIVHPEAEVAVAKAAAAVGLPMVLSTVASKPMEEVAAAMGPTLPWFQLYWGRNPDFTASLLQRAEAAGFRALVVTLDTKILGWRERDLQHAYLPFLYGDGLTNFFNDPVFRAALPEPPEQNPTQAILYFSQIFSNPALTWGDLAWLRQCTRLPILLKGLLHPDDARLALDHGADGIIVSNHGGRQVDGAVGALDALPGVAEAVAGRVPVLFDSGIRRGADVFKAVALGAQAVLLGRPYVYGLAVGGEAGVRFILQNLLADLDLTLALSGCTSWAEVDRTWLRTIP
jgi:isopentenyl diphosphate isomerase/L-lactate dehydrogenase-like FMN-dependent dehydrogenase